LLLQRAGCLELRNLHIAIGGMRNVIDGAGGASFEVFARMVDMKNVTGRPIAPTRSGPRASSRGSPIR
jgi:hypothetical protein